ncbi:transcriptional regulator [Jeotgalibacillus proteolyticus]|uniref:Transcriptional regulator n=1 Tax=Jeotgalibacillus proteolyticus TaxID=2082395 RepID=A0A2S5GFX5_9BACL|nr:transcriptional regulator [Jeotgalibacillus proteolyticus]
MRDKLFNAWKRRQLIDIIYMDSKGKVSKRRIKIRKVTEESFVAYCFMRKAKRTFHIDSVLSFVPVILKERAVI